MRSRIAKGQQVCGGERFRVTLVKIQSVNQRRAFQHDSHARMAVAVDAAFVALGITKPAFQIQIVLRQASPIAT